MKKGSYKIVKNSKDRRNYIVDFSKIKKKLKFTPKLSVSYGINEIIKNLKKESISRNKLDQLGNYKIKKKFL